MTPSCEKRARAFPKPCIPSCESEFPCASPARTRTLFRTNDHLIFDVLDASVRPSCKLTGLIQQNKQNKQKQNKQNKNIQKTNQLLSSAHTLSDVNSDAFELVLRFCYFHTSRIADGMTVIERADWDKRFVSTSLPSELCAVASAAFFLEVDALTDVTCRAIADAIKGKSPEQIRATFDIPNDIRRFPEPPHIQRARKRHSQRYNNNNNNSNGDGAGDDDVESICPGGHDHHHTVGPVDDNDNDQRNSNTASLGCNPSGTLRRGISARRNTLTTNGLSAQVADALNGITNADNIHENDVGDSGSNTNADGADDTGDGGVESDVIALHAKSVNELLTWIEDDAAVPNNGNSNNNHSGKKKKRRKRKRSKPRNSTDNHKDHDHEHEHEHDHDNENEEIEEHDDVEEHDEHDNEPDNNSSNERELEKDDNQYNDDDECTNYAGKSTLSALPCKEVDNDEGIVYIDEDVNNDGDGEGNGKECTDDVNSIEKKIRSSKTTSVAATTTTAPGNVSSNDLNVARRQRSSSPSSDDIHFKVMVRPSPSPPLPPSSPVCCDEDTAVLCSVGSSVATALKSLTVSFKQDLLLPLGQPVATSLLTETGMSLITTEMKMLESAADQEQENNKKLGETIVDNCVDDDEESNLCREQLYGIGSGVKQMTKTIKREECLVNYHNSAIESSNDDKSMEESSQIHLQTESTYQNISKECEPTTIKLLTTRPCQSSSSNTNPSMSVKEGTPLPPIQQWRKRLTEVQQRNERLDRMIADMLKERDNGKREEDLLQARIEGYRVGCGCGCGSGCSSTYEFGIRSSNSSSSTLNETTGIVGMADNNNDNNSSNDSAIVNTSKL